MIRALLLLAVLIAAPLAAADYAIEVRSGVGGIVTPPYTRIRVNIAREDTRAFVGRLVVEIGGYGMPSSRRGRGAPRYEGGDVTVTQDVSLEEGAGSRLISLDVPVTGYFSLTVRLERQISGDLYEFVAEAQDTPTVVYDESRKLVAFVSDARLKEAQNYLFYQAVEIPVNELPDSWKSLAGFNAIVLNDDRTTRAQAAALADYVAAGGTLILSPGSAGSFNPETPAGSLLRIPATTQQQWKKLSDFGPTLTAELTASGLAFPEGESGSAPREATQPMPVEAAKLVKPDPESQLRFWPESGRARPVPDSKGLVSIARVGAGNLVLLHTDISAAPFTTSDNVPTQACVKLLELAIGLIDHRTGRTPMKLLLDQDVRNSVDIAGNRIPGRDALVIVLLLYIAAAGVGMFVVARRIRRPELYPATLFVAALISVGLVFGLGEIYKRSGDRVKAVRVLVSDETTERNAVFTLGCAYSISGDSYDFLNSRKATLVPAEFDPQHGNMRGMPADPLDYSTSFTAGEALTHVTELDRWQNVFFLQREPANLENFSVEVTQMDGAFRLENRSPHELRACVFLVGRRDPAPGGANCEWHYVPRMGAAGGNDSVMTFSASTQFGESVEALAGKIADDTEESEREVFGAMFKLNLEDKQSVAMRLTEIETRLFNGGLLPEPDEFLLLAVLPADALSGSSIGAVGVDEDDIAQVNLWMVRGGLEGR